MSEESTTARPARFAGLGANGAAGASGVTLTVEELSNALRIGDSAEERQEAERLLIYTSEAILKYAPASTPAANEACIRLSAYLFDQPNAGRGLSFANAMRNSGAASILLPWRVHRAGII